MLDFEYTCEGTPLRVIALAVRFSQDALTSEQQMEPRYTYTYTHTRTRTRIAIAIAAAGKRVNDDNAVVAKGR